MLLSVRGYSEFVRAARACWLLVADCNSLRVCFCVSVLAGAVFDVFRRIDEV